MSDIDAAVATLLEEKPHLENDLQEILAIDAAHETWSFEDVPVDSGVFGELVSRGIVTKQNGAYTLADAGAVRRGLDSETASLDREVDGAGGRRSISLSLPEVSLQWAGALAVVVLMAALFRSYHVLSVFRGDHIVLLGNDPYFYRHWIRQLALSDAGVMVVPSGIQQGEPLLIGTIWTVTAVLGGSATTGYTVLALYPLVCGLLTIPLVYGITRRVTGERRIALAAALLLTVMPVHVFRTSLGFADHHAFDYLWLAVTLFAGVALTQRQVTDDVFSRPTLFWVVVLAVGVAGQTLAWNAGPLLLIPLGAFSLIAVSTARTHGKSPVTTLAPIVAGLGIASAAVWIAHLTFGWQPLQVVLAPTLLFIGVGIALAVGRVATQYQLTPQLTAGSVLVGGGAVLVLSLLVFPEFAAEFSSELTRLVGIGASEEIVETNSIFSSEYGSLFGPALFFGFAIFFALPYILWGLYVGYRDGNLTVLLIGTYASVFTVLALFQARFAGELSIALAPFVGLAFVHLGAVVDAIPQPVILDSSDSNTDCFAKQADESLAIPGRRELVTLGVVFLLIGGFGVVQGPVQTNKLVYSDDAYQTATWIDDHAAETSGENPEYVFSVWGQNRMYNAFVTGDSRSYSFAQQNFVPFMSSAQPDMWYGNLSNRVGYIVTSDIQTGPRYAETTHASLHGSYGSSTGEQDGVGHYRAVYRTPSGSHIVSQPVAGAVITGPGTPGSTISVTTNVTIPNAEFVYERQAKVNEHGVYEVRVPYPGQYLVGESSTTIREDAISSGLPVSQFHGDTYGSWSFNENSGDTAYDRSGGYHAKIMSSAWGDGINGSALSLDGSGYARTPITQTDEFTITMWVHPSRLDTSSRNDYRHLVRGGNGNLLILEESGEVSFRVPGVTSEYWAAGNVEKGQWNRVTAVYNGTHRTLYVDGERVGVDRAASTHTAAQWGSHLDIGGDRERHNFVGRIDEVRLYEEPLTAEQVSDSYAASQSNRTT